MLQESILTDRPYQPHTTLQPEAEMARNRNRKKNLYRGNAHAQRRRFFD